GYVYIVDRIKDMIVSGGENVYSVEVEKVVAQHPAVESCAVIGVPDDDLGERVHAVVVLRPGEQTTAEELREFCKQHIAGYKAPAVPNSSMRSRCPVPARSSKGSFVAGTGISITVPCTDPS